MKKLIVVILSSILFGQYTYADSKTNNGKLNKTGKSNCQPDHKSVPDLNFLPGRYDYFINEEKLGEAEYTLESNGCIILEKFKYESGKTYIGTFYFDKNRSKWKWFWVSDQITFEMFGAANADGTLTFEGEVDIHASGQILAMRSTWIVNDDRSIKQVYEIYDKNSESWGPFFSGLSKRK